jgi:hypothetical protein
MLFESTVCLKLISIQKKSTSTETEILIFTIDFPAAMMLKTILLMRDKRRGNVPTPLPPLPPPPT